MFPYQKQTGSSGELPWKGQELDGSSSAAMQAVLSSRSVLALATTLPGDTGDPEARGRHACSSLCDHFAKRCHTRLSTGALTLPGTVSARTVSLLPLAHIKGPMSFYMHTGTHCATFS